MRRKILIAWFIKFISHVPLFFALFAIFVQTNSSFYLFKHRDEYKAGKLKIDRIEKEVVGDGLGGNDKFLIFVGFVDGKETKIWKGRVRTYPQNKTLMINDVIYIWYNEDRKFTLSRNKEELSFNVNKYIYSDYRLLIIIGILQYLLISLIYKRMKKKATEENYPAN